MAAAMAAGLGRGAPRLCWKAAEPLLRPGALPPCVVVPVRSRRKGPRLPEWARELSPEERDRRLRSAAPIFPDERMERTFFLACTAEIMDPYVPPEGDARLTSLSKDGVKQQMQKLRQTAASQLALRKIKDHDPDFSTKTFPERAQEIFIEAHNSLANFNKQKLHSLVTERCYPILAIYDRFGRLMYGGEEIPKDVLEYVVFERYLVNPYGAWRMHGKIVPEWAPPKDPIIKTVMIPAPDPSQEHETVK
uniref:Large ribosomal subunit protein mL45 n=1 Tax=Geospiza parvula TaxID=87175 RepID=A0A8U8BFD3_GEOPR